MDRMKTDTPSLFPHFSSEDTTCIIRSWNDCKFNGCSFFWFNHSFYKTNSPWFISEVGNLGVTWNGTPLWLNRSTRKFYKREIISLLLHKPLSLKRKDLYIEVWLQWRSKYGFKNLCRHREELLVVWLHRSWHFSLLDMS